MSPAYKTFLLFNAEFERSRKAPQAEFETLRVKWGSAFDALSREEKNAYWTCGITPAGCPEPDSGVGVDGLCLNRRGLDSDAAYAGGRGFKVSA